MRRDASLRIGILRLTDAASIIMAKETGFFAASDLDVEICVEPSWANIADKLTYGQLDAAMLLPPLALAIALGLRGARAPIAVPMGLSLNGNSITVSRGIADAIGDIATHGAMATGQRFRSWLRRSAQRPRLGVVHVFSTHSLLLRYWLAAQQIDPDRDVEIVVIPPAETARALRNGIIDGFCAGAPWGAVAAEEGVGRTIVVSSEIWRDHAEKCLAVAPNLISGRVDRLHGLITALIRSGKFCNDATNARSIAATLAKPVYLDLPAPLIRQSLPDHDTARDRAQVDRSVFAGAGVAAPLRSHAIWFLAQMARWGYLRAGIDATALIDSVYRPDLLDSATARVETVLPAPTARPFAGFCDEKIFDPQEALRILAAMNQKTG